MRGKSEMWWMCGYDRWKTRTNTEHTVAIEEDGAFLLVKDDDFLCVVKVRIGVREVCNDLSEHGGGPYTRTKEEEEENSKSQNPDLHVGDPLPSTL
jgi:hypothetical protein